MKSPARDGLSDRAGRSGFFGLTALSGLSGDAAAVAPADVGSDCMRAA